MSEPVDFADVPAAFRDDPLKPVGVALLEPVGLKAYGLLRWVLPVGSSLFVAQSLSSLTPWRLTPPIVMPLPSA